MMLEKYDIESIKDYLKEFITHVNDQNPEIGVMFITAQHNGDTVNIQTNLNDEIRAKIILEMAKEDMSENEDFLSQRMKAFNNFLKS